MDTNTYPEFKKDKQGRIINENEKVSIIGALILQYRMLQEYQKVNELTDKLTDDEKYKFLEVCLGAAKSIAFNLYQDVQTKQRNIKDSEKDIDRLISKIDERDIVLKKFGVDMTVDKREKV